jgi:hypothetical protein
LWISLVLAENPSRFRMPRWTRSTPLSAAALPTSPFRFSPRGRRSR